MSSRISKRTGRGATDAPAAAVGGGMIANDLQYRVTRAAARRFEEGLARLDETEAHRSPEVRALMREAMGSELEELRRQLAEYEALSAGRVRVLELGSLDELPDALIRARVAAGLTQKELARRLGLRESQVQRYEATRYAGASLARLRTVADALGVQTHGRVVLPVAGGY